MEIVDSHRQQVVQELFEKKLQYQAHHFDDVGNLMNDHHYHQQILLYGLMMVDHGIVFLDHHVVEQFGND